METKFKNPTDFRKSLEARLQTTSIKTNIDLQRLRRKVAFDRLLARIFSEGTKDFYLKGGYAMELRFAHARATKDIDLTCIRRTKTKEEFLNALILDDLRKFAKQDLRDHFLYQIGDPQMDLENAPYGGARFPVTTLIDKKLFVRFQLDVGVDYLLDQAETIKGGNWLEFCGIPAPIIPMISVEQQFAEKLHAYTLPRTERTNSRVKDLVDMVLLLELNPPNLSTLSATIQTVFKKRATHPLPQTLNPPPTEWAALFEPMMIECGFSLDLQNGFKKLFGFYNEISSNN